MPPDQSSISGSEINPELLTTLGITNKLGMQPEMARADQILKRLPSSESQNHISWSLPKTVQADVAQLSANWDSANLNEFSQFLTQHNFAYSLEMHDLGKFETPENLTRKILSSKYNQSRAAYWFQKSKADTNTWQWPLKVGFLPTASAKELQHKLSSEARIYPERWNWKAVHLQQPSVDTKGCGLVVIPSLKEARQILEQDATPLSCGALLILNWDQDTQDSGYLKSGHKWMESSGIQAISFVDIDKDHTEEYLRNFLRSTSHNLSFDRAIFESYQQTFQDEKKSPPLIVGSAQSMQGLSLSGAMGTLKQQIKNKHFSLPPGAAPRPVSMPESLITLGFPPEIDDPEQLIEPLLTVEKANSVFNRERDFATDFSVLSQKLTQTFSSSERSPNSSNQGSLPNNSEGSGATLPKSSAEVLPEKTEISSPHITDNGADPLRTSEETTSGSPSDSGSQSPEPIPQEDESTRFLQAEVKVGDPKKVATQFHAGETHQITFHIGSLKEGYIQPDRSEPFPIEHLPKSEVNYDLTLVLFSDPNGGDLQREEVSLPRGSGDSTTAVFDWRPKTSSAELELKLIVLFKNRILQCARLFGPVLHESANPDVINPIKLRIDAAVSAFVEDFQDSTEFQYSLLIDSCGTNLQVARTTKSKVHLRSHGQEMSEILQRLNGLISEMAFEPDKYTGELAQNQDLRRMFIRLARDGSDFRKLILEQVPVSNAFDSKEPIQVVFNGSGGKIPIEYAYDFPPPSIASQHNDDEDAKLCEGAAECLTQGTICNRDHSRNVFCPTGFWGLSRILERHGFQASDERADFILKNGRSSLRTKIQIREKSLLAGTKRVDETFHPDGGLSRIEKELSQLNTEASGRLKVTTWKDWLFQVKKHKPKLIALIVHTKQNEYHETIMEIGDGSWTTVRDLDSSFFSAEAEAGPLVFLLGCETGTDEIQSFSLASGLKRKGASIVVSSDATINALHAIPALECIIRTFASEIRNQTKRNQTKPLIFGEIMRRARCQLINEGIPISLSLTAYGDADWLLA